MAKEKTTYGGAGAAGAFLTGSTAQAPEAEQEQQTYFREKKETRSKRINALIAPTLHEKATEKAAELGISMNELITRAIFEYIQK